MKGGNDIDMWMLVVMMYRGENPQRACLCVRVPVSLSLSSCLPRSALGCSLSMVVPKDFFLFFGTLLGNFVAEKRAFGFFSRFLLRHGRRWSRSTSFLIPVT